MTREQLSRVPTPNATRDSDWQSGGVGFLVLLEAQNENTLALCLAEDRRAKGKIGSLGYDFPNSHIPKPIAIVQTTSQFSTNTLVAQEDRDAMWKWTHKKDENRRESGVRSGRPSTAPSAVGLPSPEPVKKIPGPESVNDFHPAVTHIGKSIVIKGELSAGENVYLDGELEGSIELRNSDLTVGPNGRICAHLQARNIFVQGRVNGNLYGVERVELKNSAVLVGDIRTQRIAIEEGAQLKGGVLIQKVVPSP